MYNGKEKNYPFPYLHNESQKIAKADGAERTPEVFLFDSKRSLQYHGAPDDNHENPSAVRECYLRDAIIAVLEGKSVPRQETAPRGYTIKWK